MLPLFAVKGADGMPVGGCRQPRGFLLLSRHVFPDEAPHLPCLLLKQLGWERLAESVHVGCAQHNNLLYSSHFS